MSCGQCSHKYYFAEGIFCFCRIFLNLGVVLLCFSFDTPMAYPSNQWMSRSRVRCFEQVRVFRGPQNAEGVPISLVKWGWGGPHITRDMGTGVPISRGSPHRAYTGSLVLSCEIVCEHYQKKSRVPVRGVATWAYIANLLAVHLSYITA